MKSKFGEKFNHDTQADSYDEEVTNEENPIREGYRDILLWIKKNMPKSGVAIELGCGTGNTTKVFPDTLEKIICIDVSSEMIGVAKEKLKNRKKIVFIEDDLLAFLCSYKKKDVDVIVSMYAIHHLTQEEKHNLFQASYDVLKDKGKIIFADLMFRDRRYKKEMIKKYPNLKEDFEAEFFWFIEEEVSKLRNLGFVVKEKRFSDLSWAIYGEKKGKE